MDKMPRLLFVDDDKAFCDLLQSQMEGQPYVADFVNGHQSAFQKLKENTYDLLILDILMPGRNGLDLAREIKKQYPQQAFIFLTAQNDFHYKAEGFEAGADDYISKPFNFAELIYRVKALLRRSSALAHEQVPTIIKIGNDYAFHALERKLILNNEVKILSQKEAELLQILCSPINRVVTREELLKKVWGKTDEFTIDSMDVYMTRLRKHLKGDGSIKIENIRGTGFKLVFE